jgi:hypothetical protein
LHKDTVLPFAAKYFRLENAIKMVKKVKPAGKAFKSFLAGFVE